MEGSKRWEWQPNIYDLKTFDDATTTVWNCSPYVMICGLDSQGLDPIVTVHLEMSKVFLHSPDMGWHWHKSWKLPSFKLTVSVADPESQEEILCPENLVFSVYATTLQTLGTTRATFQQLKLVGNSCTRIKNGTAFLEGLKFEDTSYNLNGGKIHLMWSISFQDEIIQSGAPKILYSKISPPIFVDSRAGAIEALSVKKPLLSSAASIKTEASESFLRPAPKKLGPKSTTNKKPQANKKELLEASKPNLHGLAAYLAADWSVPQRNLLFYLLKYTQAFSLYIPAVLGEIWTDPSKFHSYICSPPTCLDHMPFLVLNIQDMVTGLQAARTVFTELKKLWWGQEILVLLDPDGIPEKYVQVPLGTVDSPGSLVSQLSYSLESSLAGSHQQEVDSQSSSEKPADQSTEQQSPADKHNTCTASGEKQGVSFTYLINSHEIEKEFGLTTLDLLKIPVINLQKTKTSGDHDAKRTFGDEDMEHFASGRLGLMSRLW